MGQMLTQVKGMIRRSYVARKLVERAEINKLKKADLSKINFGCGTNILPGWTNTDGGDGKHFFPPPLPEIVRLDVWNFLRRTPDAVARFITSEQFFEHFTRQDGIGLLRHWHRILMPGGVLRIQTVDLEKEIQVYLNICPGVSWEKDVLPHRTKYLTTATDFYGGLCAGERYTRSMLLNNGFHMNGHKYIYDFETIQQSLHVAGFTKIKREVFGCSDYPELRGIDHHDGGETGRHWVPLNVLTVEAVKT
jgi:predicted SAM-dependent methyltransferase